MQSLNGSPANASTVVKNRKVRAIGQFLPHLSDFNFSPESPRADITIIRSYKKAHYSKLYISERNYP